MRPGHSADEIIANVKADIRYHEGYLDQVQELIQRYPDLREEPCPGHSDLVFSSAISNPRAEHWALSRCSCGDLGVSLWSIPSWTIFASPPFFKIEDGWQEKLKKAKISETVILEIARFLAETPAKNLP